jgi:hypothetical protein
MTVIHDPRFDPLSPPPNLFPEPPAVVFEFSDDSVTLIYADGKSSFAESYAPDFFTVFECLETGVMTRACALLLHKRLRCQFEEGCVFCKCIDRRVTPTRETSAKLEVGPEVVAYVCQDVSDGDALHVEASALKLHRPVICTDPSPDVARVQSLIDFRKKMWMCRRVRARTEDVVRRVVGERPREPRKVARIEQTRAAVKIPDQIVKLCNIQQ